MLDKYFNPAGGLYYHLRAYRYKNIWQPFIDLLHQELIHRLSPTRNLLLVGPSAGYCLKTSFLTRYEHLTCIDIDPLASKLFFSLHQPKSIQWDSTNYLIQPKKLNALNQLYPQYTLLFCNILGQLPLINPSYPHQLNEWKDTLQSTAQNHPWCSFHDCYSLSCDKVPLDILSKKYSEKESALEELKSHLPISVLEVGDHQTSDLFAPHYSRCYLWWLLKPRKLHLIEIVSA